MRDLACLIALGMLTLCSAHRHTQESEESVKAAFIYNFTRFVTWPSSAFSSASSPFVIGIVGGDSIQSELETIVRGKRVGDRPIVVKRLSWSNADACNLLFVPGDESGHATPLAKLQSRGILIVSESPGMLRRGSTINLFLEQNRVLFEISSNPGRETGLTFSSHLLSLARSPH